MNNYNQEDQSREFKECRTVFELSILKTITEQRKKEMENDRDVTEPLLINRMNCTMMFTSHFIANQSHRWLVTLVNFPPILLTDF